MQQPTGPQSTKSPPANTRQRNQLQSLPPNTFSGRPDTLTQGNDWAFGDRGPAPEKEATKEGAPPDISYVTPLSGVSEDEDQVLEDIKPSIYKTHAGRRRAKIPDAGDPVNVADHASIASQSHQVNGDGSDRSKPHWRKRKSRPGPTPMIKSKQETTLRHIMLRWDKVDDKVLLHATPSLPNVRSQIQPQTYVSWQHHHTESMTLQGLEDQVNSTKIHGVQESEVRLFRRLLKRVRLESERPFVGGKFLTPRSLRYDSVDSSKYAADKSCIFLAFPYFAVVKEQPSPIIAKGSQKHSIRSLLQSIYRLNDTYERDQIQSIRMLTCKSVRSCIEADESDIRRISPKLRDELIYVPQLWALIIGLDRLMTFGSISDKSLQGRSVAMHEDMDPQVKKSCFLVRVRFEAQGRAESMTYPVEQCASWFGLVNKQQQIRMALNVGREPSNSEQYKMYINGQVIEATTWQAIQKATTDEVLELWMETPKATVFQVSVESPKESEQSAEAMTTKGSIKQTSDVDGSEYVSANLGSGKDNQTIVVPNEEPQHVVEKAIKFVRVEKIPVVLPFLEWRIVDESGEVDDCSATERCGRFLDFIYRNLPAKVGDTTAGFTNTKAKENASTDERCKRSFSGKTSSDVEKRSHSRLANKEPHERKVIEDMLQSAGRILCSFVPRRDDPGNASLDLYWGVIHELIMRASTPYIKDLHVKLDVLHHWIERIHLGVLIRSTDIVAGGPEEKNDISESAILLSSTVDAFGAIFNFFIQSASDVIVDSTISKCGSQTCKFFEEARGLLVTARDELIVEASGMPAGEQIGPVFTPEAILIMHVERLVCGVYGNGTVDIINILEECLEQLALKVRYRYSRRLLQMINAFEEEVVAVHSVLIQQQRVLIKFRDNLDPKTFDTPSTARYMRFDYERKGIERVLMILRDQLKNCKELQSRAEVLAIQNVHLVETLQDDNGRAIFIFTFITILFLPLSFVAGFFGMNLQGINGTSYGASLFWKIAVPVTGAIMLLCFAVIIWGERMWFGLASMPRYFVNMYRLRSNQDNQGLN